MQLKVAYGKPELLFHHSEAANCDPCDDDDIGPDDKLDGIMILFCSSSRSQRVSLFTNERTQTDRDQLTYLDHKLSHKRSSLDSN